MPLVTWNDRYATGIPKVDEQHKIMFQAINTFHGGIVAAQGKESLAQTLDFLMTHTVDHFRTEEAFMQSMGYEGLAAHRSEHQLLLEEVASFKQQWTGNEAWGRPTEVARFMGDWLTRHIQQMDFQYVKFMKAKGIIVP
jgi:hemerythrin